MITYYVQGILLKTKMQIEMKTDVFSKRLVIDFIKQETNSKCLYQKGEMDVFEVQRNEISINV